MLLRQKSKKNLLAILISSSWPTICFGLRTAVVTALVDNAVGRLREDLILQGGVDMRHVKWAAFDGVGREAR
ncbi:MAG: hypothetical protein AAB382_02360, partial [Chloroflexota bacterium]